MKHRSSVLFCAAAMITGVVTWPGQANASPEYWRSVNGFTCAPVGFTMAWYNPGTNIAQASNIAGTERYLECAMPNDSTWDHTFASSVEVVGYQQFTSRVGISLCVGYYAALGGRCGSNAYDSTHSGATRYQIFPATTYWGSANSAPKDSPFVSIDLSGSVEYPSTVQTIYIEYNS